jgi:hypothetical protein
MVRLSASWATRFSTSMNFRECALGSGSTNGSYPRPINTPPCAKNPPLYNPNHRNFDPRISIAWAPTALDGRTVIRAGFGIYHGAAQNDDLNAGLESDRYTAFVDLDPSGPGTPLLPAYQQEIPDLSGLGSEIVQQPCDKGPSIFDVRHNLVVNAVYELPFGPSKSYLNSGGVMGKIVGGWSLSSLGLWHTGHPLTISMNISPAQLPDGNDQTTQWPDLVPGVPVLLPGSGQKYTLPINPAAFAPPPLDPAGAGLGLDQNGNPVCNSSCGLVSRFGSAPNGLIRALNAWQIDLALMKTTSITERVAVEFGVQAFNIFNHVQLGDPAPGNLAFNYVSTTNSQGNVSWGLSPAGNLGLITTTNNFNNNNDNAISPNTGTGLPAPDPIHASIPVLGCGVSSTCAGTS